MSRTGRAAEDAARRHLEAQGLRCLAANVSCRVGELDLIMQDSRELVVVEVRCRAASALVDAASTVTVHKQRRILAATRHWLSRHPQWHEHPLRFDVVAVDGPALRWIPNAFDAA